MGVFLGFFSYLILVSLIFLTREMEIKILLILPDIFCDETRECLIKPVISLSHRKQKTFKNELYALGVMWKPT